MYDPDYDRKEKGPVVKRRTKAQMIADNEAWWKRITDSFEAALDEWDWPDYFRSDLMLDDAVGFGELNNFYVLRRNMEKALAEFEYVKMINPGTNDGRWNIDDKNVFIYKKDDLRDLHKAEIKERNWA